MSGKKNLRSAAKTAEMDREEQMRQRVSNPVAEETKDPSRFFYEPASEAERKKLHKEAKLIFEVARFPGGECFFDTRRSKLGSALRFLRFASNWEVTKKADGAPDDFFYLLDTLKGIIPLVTDYKDKDRFEELKFALEREEIVDLWYLGQLLHMTEPLLTANQDIEEILVQCGFGPGVDVFSEMAMQDNIGRGHMCHILADIVIGADHLKFKPCAFHWVTEEHIRKVCRAITHVLSDPRSEAQTNGWCYSAICTLCRDPRWVEIVCEIMIEPARRVALSNRVDTMQIGDFPAVLLRMSKGHAKAIGKRSQPAAAGSSSSTTGANTSSTDAAGAGAGAGSAEKNQEGGKKHRKGVDELTTDDELDDSNATLTDEDWEYFMTVYRRNSNGIPSCQCNTVLEPKLYCSAQKARKYLAEIDKCFTRIAALQESAAAVTVGESGAEDKAKRDVRLQLIVKLANDVLGSLSAYKECGASCFQTVPRIRRKAQLILGNAYRDLNRVDEAVLNYTAACANDYGKDFASSVSSVQAEAMYEMARALYTKKRYPKALMTANAVLEAKPGRILNPLAKEGDKNRHIICKSTKKNVAMWRAKARELIALCQEAIHAAAIAESMKTASSTGTGTSTTGAANDSNAPAANGTFGVADFPVAKVSWNSMGELQSTASEDFHVVLVVIPRLSYVLLFVRGDLLLWDYAREEVVHWIVLGDTYGREGLTHFFYDIPERKAAWLCFREPFKGQFLLVNLERLSPRGGRTHVSTCKKLGSGSFDFINVHPFIPISTCKMAASKDEKGKWRLAHSHFRKLGVTVYKAGDIHEDSVLGPFCLSKDPSLFVAGPGCGDDDHVTHVEMVGTSSLLVTSDAKSPYVRVWDALGEHSMGACVQTILVGGIERSICCSNGLLFVAFPPLTRIKTPTADTPEPRSLSVWRLQFPDSPVPVDPNSQAPPPAPSPKLGTVTSPPPPPNSIIDCRPPRLCRIDIEEEWRDAALPHMCFLPQSNLLVVSQIDGTAAIWRIWDERAGAEVIEEGNTQEAEQLCLSTAQGPIVSHLRTLKLRVPEPGEKHGALKLRFMIESPSRSGVLYIANMYSVMALNLSRVRECISSSTAPAAEGAAGVASSTDASAASMLALVVQKALGQKAKILNCQHCGVWNVKKSSYCGACKAVFFCDRECQKLAWPQHKLVCNKSAAKKT